jgi:hypothetical protein
MNPLERYFFGVSINTSLDQENLSMRVKSPMYHIAVRLLISSAFVLPSVSGITVAQTAAKTTAKTTSQAVPKAAKLPAGVTFVTSLEGISEYRLKNGLKVLLFPDSSKPTVTVNITYLLMLRNFRRGVIDRFSHLF